MDYASAAPPQTPPSLMPPCAPVTTLSPLAQQDAALYQLVLPFLCTNQLERILFLNAPVQVHPVYVLPIAMLISPGVSLYRAKTVSPLAPHALLRCSL